MTKFLRAHYSPVSAHRAVRVEVVMKILLALLFRLILGLFKGSDVPGLPTLRQAWRII